MSTTATQNPVINQQGSAAIDSGQFATWNTANGSQSTLTITNSSRANTLTFTIAGAPAGVNCYDNGATKPANGLFNIPPNSPSYSVVCNGNFAGAQVTVSNITNAQNDATAEIQAQTTQG
ncbi:MULTISPECIES: hypothetical protein [Tenacibaculum]|uniref:Uncharacterized protein n=1 Tax=Tenacibaculum discolor TaxID=361581 RepID=A0A2G1BYX5_9FLAO|nr:MULTISPECIES: hypothetical protein [Tenacibaculum]MDP2541324.1 hypothetical protein [Tenacibaculum discolor]NVK09218.1 hypothetical protein [Tenacibaculum sp.]PHN99216.1 hypothetical protein CSC81_00965 [Tenacibaculum discolor]RLJ96414.1 hypothetical protein C8N27_3169 [Tenacibaculum discolor]